jgi:hypothetical protein
VSRNFTVLRKSASQGPTSSPWGVPEPRPDAGGESAPRSREYNSLIRLLFDGPAAVALVGTSHNGEASDEGISVIAERLGAELAVIGKRVVVVPFSRLLRMNPITIPAETDFMPGSAPQVWIWPGTPGPKIEFFKSREASSGGNWLDSLRQNFDSVLLDCPNVEAVAGVSEVAAMADAVVLSAEAGVTLKRQVQHDQRALQLRGARVVGCILIEQYG